MLLIRMSVYVSPKSEVGKKSHLLCCLHDASSLIMAKFGSKRARTKQQLEEHAAESKKSRMESKNVLQNGAACFYQSPVLSAASAPAIVVTLFSAMAAVRVLSAAPPISRNAAAFVRIEQSATSPPRPPLLPAGRINSTISKHVSEATRWAKLAWLIECRRVDIEGGEISDANLKKYFHAGKAWYATHRDKPEVRAALGI